MKEFVIYQNTCPISLEQIKLWRSILICVEVSNYRVYYYFSREKIFLELKNHEEKKRSEEVDEIPCPLTRGKIIGYIALKNLPPKLLDQLIVPNSLPLKLKEQGELVVSSEKTPEENKEIRAILKALHKLDWSYGPSTQWDWILPKEQTFFQCCKILVRVFYLFLFELLYLAFFLAASPLLCIYYLMTGELDFCKNILHPTISEIAMLFTITIGLVCCFVSIGISIGYAVHYVIRQCHFAKLGKSFLQPLVISEEIIQAIIHDYHTCFRKRHPGLFAFQSASSAELIKILQSPDLTAKEKSEEIMEYMAVKGNRGKSLYCSIVRSIDKKISVESKKETVCINALSC